MPRVLVVDDEELARYALRKLLSRSFREIEVIAEAETGSEAVSMAERYRPDLICMDIKIPGLNGLEASREILARLPEVKILMISAYDSFSLLQDAIRIGVDGYLLKPVREDDFRREYNRLFQPSADQSSGGATPLSSGRYPKDLERRIIKILRTGDFQELSREAPLFADIFLSETESGFIRYGFEFCVVLKREFEPYLNVAAIAELSESLNRLAVLNYPRELKEWLVRWLRRCVELVETNHEGDLKARIIRALDSTPVRAVSLEQLARELEVSPQYFSSRFAELFGRNFIEEITERRLAEARRLLAESSLSVQEVGQAVGYGDANYFTRLFRKYSGVTPSRFREQIKHR